MGDPGFVREKAPPGSKIVVDNVNGRFLVCLGDRVRRSFSWSRRGMDEAALATLQCLWQWYGEDTGAANPFASAT